jgi:hypothetical protein
MRVEILITFDGYPDGERVTFVEGSTVEVSAEYGELLFSKGLVLPVDHQEEPTFGTR